MVLFATGIQIVDVYPIAFCTKIIDRETNPNNSIESVYTSRLNIYDNTFFSIVTTACNRLLFLFPLDLLKSCVSQFPEDRM